MPVRTERGQRPRTRAGALGGQAFDHSPLGPARGGGSKTGAPTTGSSPSTSRSAWSMSTLPRSSSAAAWAGMGRLRSGAGAQRTSHRPARLRTLASCVTAGAGAEARALPSRSQGAGLVSARSVRGTPRSHVQNRPPAVGNFGATTSEGSSLTIFGKHLRKLINQSWPLFCPRPVALPVSDLHAAPDARPPRERCLADEELATAVRGFVLLRPAALEAEARPTRASDHSDVSRRSLRARRGPAGEHGSMPLNGETWSPRVSAALRPSLTAGSWSSPAPTCPSPSRRRSSATACSRVNRLRNRPADRRGRRRSPGTRRSWRRWQGTGGWP